MYRQRDFIELFLAVGCPAVGLVLALFLSASFLAMVARVLRRVSPDNRRMRPNQVWLNFIPIFNILWSAVTVERVAESLRSEFTEREMHSKREEYGRRLGLMSLGFGLFSVVYLVAIITIPMSIYYFVCYWRELNRYEQRLKSGEYVPPPVDDGW